MPSYHYRAKQGPEKLVEGVIEAANEATAIEKINQMGFVPVHIRLSMAEPDREASSPVLKMRTKTKTRIYLFSGHLARLIKAGIPITRAMRLLASNEKDPVMREALESIEKDIHQGRSLSSAMEARPEIFPRLYVAAVNAGEMSGGLEQSLIRMSAYFKKQDEFRSKIRRAMAYPLVLALAGVASIFFILTFLVPRLEGVFAGMGPNIPFSTRMVLATGSFLHLFWMPIVAVFVLAAFFLPRFLKGRIGQMAWDAFKLRIFFTGDLIKKTEFARFSRTLALSFANGLPFLRALQVSIPTVENTAIRSALESCAKNVEKGGSFGQALKRESLFNGLAANLISVGEESGRVEETLMEIAELYEQEADEQLMYLTTLLEPLMILVVGGIIGFIVIAVLLPIFDMSSHF